jgi:hypothetical protein
MTPAWLAAERSGAYGVGPGASWDDAPWLNGDGTPPTSPSARCRRCRYRTAARGHAVACGPVPVVLTRRAHAAAGGLR